MAFINSPRDARPLSSKAARDHAPSKALAPVPTATQAAAQAEHNRKRRAHTIYYIYKGKGNCWPRAGGHLGLAYKSKH